MPAVKSRWNVTFFYIYNRLAAHLFQFTGDYICAQLIPCKNKQISKTNIKLVTLSARNVVCHLTLLMQYSWNNEGNMNAQCKL